MGIYGRDYMREPRRTGWGGGVSSFFAGRSLTTWLIGVNVAVFILDYLLLAMFRLHYDMPIPVPGGAVFHLRFPLLYGLGHFSQWTAINNIQIWRFITFQFLHADLNHLVFNMLSLFFFGPIV